MIGEPKLRSKGLEFYQPEYRLFKDSPPPLEKSLTPVYSTCEGVSSKRISQLIQQALDLLEAHPQTSLLKQIFSSRFTDIPVYINELLATIHQPISWDDASLLSEGRHPFQKQFALEELVAHSLSAQTRRSLEKNPDAQVLSFDKELHNSFTKTLSFSLTNAQEKVINEISFDIKKTKAMRRLVQGDVGSGKTLVAASVALQAIQQGKQVALMVPTEILAEQHVQNFKNWFKPFHIEVESILGKHSAKVRKETLERIAKQKACLVIGTHALFQKDVIFNDLALIIIDEQHRFGVHQRLALSQKAEDKLPHQ